MIAVDLRDRAVVVTGGTRGLGRAIGCAFARAGARVILTHRWGNTPDAEVVAAFAATGLPAPDIVESDAGDPDAARDLMAHVAGTGLALHAIVSNVAMAKIVHGLDDLKPNALDLSTRYSAWPVVELVKAADEVLGELPPYVVAISSDGTRLCHPGYDLAGASKATLECLCRYLAVRLKPRGVRVNVVQPGALRTDSALATFGEPALDVVRARLGDVFIDPDRVGRAVVGLCSGLLDSVTGQVLVVDEGWSLISPLSMLEAR